MVSQVENKKINKKGVLITIGILVLLVLSLVIVNCIKNKNIYNEAVEMFSSGKYYRAMTQYYNSLSDSYKKKFDEMIIEKISQYRWKSDNPSIYTNFNDCKGYSYLEIKNNMTDDYVICVDDESQTKHQWSGLNMINFTYSSRESDSSRFALKFSGSNSLYLFFYNTNEIIIAEGSVHTVGGQTKSELYFSKFHEDK